jgi:hypothetical protein
LMHFGRPFGTLFDQIGQFPEQVAPHSACRHCSKPK